MVRFWGIMVQRAQASFGAPLAIPPPSVLFTSDVTPEVIAVFVGSLELFASYDPKVLTSPNSSTLDADLIQAAAAAMDAWVEIMTNDEMMRQIAPIIQHSAPYLYERFENARTPRTIANMKLIKSLCVALHRKLSGHQTESEHEAYMRGLRSAVEEPHIYLGSFSQYADDE